MRTVDPELNLTSATSQKSSPGFSEPQVLTQDLGMTIPPFPGHL